MPPSIPPLPTPRPRLHLSTLHRRRHPHNNNILKSTTTTATTISRPFTTTPSQQSQTHYDTLSLPPTATPQDIKRQFFALSKLHHPDRNPSDPTASTRFVAISEAYHVLSVPEKRAKYDEQIGSSHSGRRGWGRGHAHHQHTGSYSSAQGGFAGSRPATGLNKKRGTFRGPPPSFYKSGGYGETGHKRAEYAYGNPQDPHGGGGSTSANQQSEGHSYGDFAGHGPGQTGRGIGVGHFDDLRHKRTHDSVYDHIAARRRRNREREIPEDGERIGPLVRFLLVGGAVVMCGITATAFGGTV